MEDNTYIDDSGYKRFSSSSKLVHREIAFNRIYLPNRHKYTLPFAKYVVHHIDGNPQNNEIHNLQLVTQRGHQIIHEIDDEQSIVDHIAKQYDKAIELEKINSLFKKSIMIYIILFVILLILLVLWILR